MMNKLKTGRQCNKRAFTLVEVIIAASIFTAISTLAAIIFINVLRAQRQISLENAIYEDARFLMERISREIRQNTIDYDEYYNRDVESEQNFGATFGCYASRFYNPGTNGPGKEADGTTDSGSKLGAYCSYPPAASATTTPQDSPGCIIDKSTLDINTGMNPYAGNGHSDPSAQAANAFCDKKYNNVIRDCTVPAIQIGLYDRGDKLYLIDSTGKQKTILALKSINSIPEKALSMIKIRGQDVAPADGIYEKWYDTAGASGQIKDFFCAPGYECCAIGAGGTCTPKLSQLDESLDVATFGLYAGFVPISPLRSKITDLHFYVSPLEDPRKAFAETDLNDGILQQPHVTVVLTLEPSESQLGLYNGAPPSITLQSTITSRIYNEIPSYDGVSRCSSYAN